jgi:colanic acid/amylovoran biosynthesis glycosyltransferase
MLLDDATERSRTASALRENLADETGAMRVALVVPTFPKLSETFIVSHAAALAKAGIDVSVHCRRFDRSGWTKRLGEDPDLEGIRVCPRPRLRPVWRAIALAPLQTLRLLLARPAVTARYLHRAVRSHGARAIIRLYEDTRLILEAPDIVHVEFGSLAAERPDLGHLLGRQMVVSFRGYDLNFVGLDKRGYYDEVWRRADYLHFLGEDLLHRAVQRGLPSGKPYKLIPPAVDADLFTPPDGRSVRDDDKTTLSILSIGRLHWKKGYEYGLAAVAILRDRGIDLTYRILGGGEHLEAVAFARHQLGLDDCVEILGPAGHQELRRQLEWADVVLHPAVSEGFSNAVLEAQAAGLPVVSSDADGLRENVIDQTTGIVTERRNVQAMAAALERLAGSPELRSSMGTAGRERARALNPAAQIEAFLAMYEELAS